MIYGKDDFPLLRNNDICYLDSASTSQKPQSVIDAEVEFYTKYNANVGRGIYRLAEQATELYEGARIRIARFIGAQPQEIICTSNATHGINTVASMLRPYLSPGDEIVLSELEHHANLIPWQMLAKERGVKLIFIPVLSDGMLDMHNVERFFTKKTKLLAITQCSNSLGTVVDVSPFVARARAVGAYVLIDGCQSVPHGGISVQALDADFLVFSGHKMLGPTGIGVLWMREPLHEQLSPVAYGGGMLFNADWVDATWLKAPHKFEAGTPPIAQAIGLGAAVDYLERVLSQGDLRVHEASLCARLIAGLETMPSIRILGPREQLVKEGFLVSFVVDHMHAHDVAAFLDKENICVRAGHFCAQPLATKLGYQSAVRVSFYLYSTHEDVDRLLQALYCIVK